MGVEQLAAFCERAGIICRKNEILSEHCTFNIGGPADLFIEPATERQLMDTIRAAAQEKVKLYVLGNGSNTLFSDEGFCGAILYIRHGFTDMRLIDSRTIECESGASIKALTRFALENSLTGLEFAYGIPGSVGGGIYMNAGAYEGEMKNVVAEAYHITNDGRVGKFAGEELDFGYRHSVYTDSGFVITKAAFKLQEGDKEQIRAKMEDYMRRRHEKQPLDLPSAGSTFRRPVGGYASELIDRCGLKGRRVGGAMVSEKHAGFVVNAGNATCKDVLALIDVIRHEVKEKTGFELKCEVKVIEP